MTTLIDHIHGLAEYGERDAFIYHAAFRTFRWSYSKLLEDVQRTAAFLESLGVNHGDRVVIWAPNSPQWGMVFLATLYRGGAAVPADMGSTPDFVNRIVKETEARVVFRSRFLDELDLDAPAVLIEDLLDEIEERQPQEAPAQVDKDDIAQVLYTSGTTGAPKGVILTHQNIAANIRSVEQSIDIGPNHQLVSILPLSHSFEQIASFWSAISHGATIVYLQLLKPSELFNALNVHPVTVLAVVPEFLGLIESRIRDRASDGLKGRLFENLLSQADRFPMGLRRVLFFPVHAQIGRSFQFFIVGGSALEPEDEQFWDRLGFVVLQGYGLSEAAPVVSVNRTGARKHGSAGQPLPGVEVRIADDGEVLVRGDNVSPGYFKNPGATSETFIDGWLHTGDIGELDNDNFLFIKGRKKDVIVTGAGLNVYPPDVESALHHQQGVQHAAVLEHNNQVHAVLILEDGADPDAAVDGVNAGLAEHQRVRGYTIWPDPDFPRSATRKPRKHEILDRLKKMDEEPDREAPEGQADEQRDVSEVVQVVARVSGKPVQDVTPGAQLGSDLDLDSIGRIQLVGMLEQQLNREVGEEALDDETTVAHLEQIVAQEPEEKREFARWSRSRPARVAREVFQTGVLFPLYRLLVRQETRGLEHLEGINEPVIFAPNHISHLDTVAVYRALPRRFRRNLAVAQLAEFFEAPSGRISQQMWRSFLYYFFTVGFNVFPLPRTRGFRQSLSYTGELIDNGWNILVYPEGHQSYTGDLEPFQEGIGVMAGEMRAPVVPVHIHGTYEVLPRHRRIPRRGDVTVQFGEPITSRKESYEGFTQRLEDAVRALSERSP